jgi:hypothetical protein
MWKTNTHFNFLTEHGPLKNGEQLVGHQVPKTNTKPPLVPRKVNDMMIGKAQNLPNIIVMYVCNFYSYLNITYVCMYVIFWIHGFHPKPYHNMITTLLLQVKNLVWYLWVAQVWTCCPTNWIWILSFYWSFNDKDYSKFNIFYTP